MFVSILRVIIIVIGILGMLYVLYGYRENFAIYNGYSKYNGSSLLLDDVYKTKKEYKLNDNNYKPELNKITPMSSYEQITNHWNQWNNSPDNNLCTPIDLCDTLYENKTDKRENKEGEMGKSYEFCLPNINSKQTRVNYYVYHNS